MEFESGSGGFEDGFVELGKDFVDGKHLGYCLDWCFEWVECEFDEPMDY